MKETEKTEIMQQQRQIQWYPGHMTKARRAITEDLKVIDLVIELTDARVPQSGRNPDIDRLAKQKARILILNKADMADENATAQWAAFYRSQGIYAIPMDARKTDVKKRVMETVMEACHEKLERDKRRGIQNRPIRAMVAGIPNVGKSTFINSFAKKTAAKTGNKPGVTRGNQWIHVASQLELLDTPGILWPKFEDQKVGLHLAMLGSINDDILNVEELVYEFLRIMGEQYPDRLLERYGITQEMDRLVQMETIARRRGCLRKGNEPDYERASRAFIEDFRSGKLGRITLEYIPDSMR